MLPNILRSAAVLSLFVASSAQADPARVTRGDAEAVFQAFESGGWAILLQPGEVEGGPAEFLPDDLVRIIPNVLWNGRHFCSLDWHAIALAINEGRRPGESISNQEIFDRLAARQPALRLDGVLLETERTEPRRMLNPELRGFTEAFFVIVGRVMAPEDIAVGQHTLQGFNNAGGSIGLITFYIDGSGTGVCGSDDALTFREVK